MEEHNASTMNADVKRLVNAEPGANALCLPPLDGPPAVRPGAGTESRQSKAGVTRTQTAPLRDRRGTGPQKAAVPWGEQREECPQAVGGDSHTCSWGADAALPGSRTGQCTARPLPAGTAVHADGHSHVLTSCTPMPWRTPHSTNPSLVSNSAQKRQRSVSTLSPTHTSRRRELPHPWARSPHSSRGQPQVLLGRVPCQRCAHRGGLVAAQMAPAAPAGHTSPGQAAFSPPLHLKQQSRRATPDSGQCPA